MKTILLFLALFVTTSQAATVRLYFIDPLTNNKDTNAFYITPIGTNVLSSGGVVGRGVTTRYVPASNGYATNTLAVGHYSITNRSLGSGVVIRVPETSSLYDYTNLLISGYNTFVTINNYTNSNSGAAVSNVFGLTFALDTRYTNSTAYYAQISSSMTFTQQNSSDSAFYFFIDTNLDGTIDFRRTNWFHVNSGTTWSRTTFTETVPPGAAYGATNISNGTSTMAADALSGAIIYFSTNSASVGGAVQTNISYTAVTNLTSFGALTNNDTRNVTFLGTVASSGFQGDGNGLTELDADNLIYGSIPIGRISDGLITSNKLDATAYVAFMGGGTGSSIAAGTNIVTVTNGSLVTVHGTANVTQTGLAAGSYLFGNILLTNGYFSVQTGSTNYDWMIFTNGTLALPAYNTSETTIERGISFFNTNSTLSSRIITWADHTGTPNTPEMMLECSGGVALKPGAINIGTFNRPFIQLGHNGNGYGAYTFMSYGPAGITDGVANSLAGQGHSSSLNFRLISTNGSGGYVYSDPGIMAAGGGDQAEVFGPGGQMSARGKLGFYTVAPIFNGTSYSSYPGIMVFEMGTNYLAMQGTNQFIGNAAGVTNQNYAIFQQIIASGAAHTTFPSATFTNVNWTTNAAALSFDSGAAFTLSNNVIIVNSSGAGRWRVRSSVPFYNNNSGSSGACMTRLYRINNTPSSLAQGQSVYQYGYSCPDSRINAVVTLAAGDVFAIQAWAASTADTQIGVTNGSGENHAGAILEMERQ